METTLGVVAGLLASILAVVGLLAARGRSPTLTRPAPHFPSDAEQEALSRLASQRNEHRQEVEAVASVTDPDRRSDDLAALTNRRRR